MASRILDFSMRPELLSRQLGHDLYRAAEALKQLVANALDADCSRVDVQIHFNDLEAPDRVIIADDGCGIAPHQMADAFGGVGVHVSRSDSRREAIGSRGIGRFAVFALSVESRWETVAATPAGPVKQSWVLAPGSRAIEIAEALAEDPHTGTTVDMTLTHREDVKRLFGSILSVKRALFNAFAGYLARYGNEVTISVNGDPVNLDDYVEDRQVEQIEEQQDVPAATLHHMVLGQQVEQAAPTLLVFAAHGAPISQEVLGDEGIPAKKYLGLVDSDCLVELTNAAKSELPEFDPRFQALRSEATERTKHFIAKRQGDRAKAFLERARAQPYYPYSSPPRTPVDSYRRQLYDGLLLTLEETHRISNASSSQQQLIFGLTKQLLQSEDLASVLTSVLGLEGEEVSQFASLLRRTSLSSIIAVADLLVDRIRFLDEIEVLVYGPAARWVKERAQPHKIIEAHTWLFGEQYHLMSSDKRVHTLLERVALAAAQDDSDGVIDVDPSLRDIPDLYLARDTWNEGAKYYQHLIVELKRPSVRISVSRIRQLHRYAEQIVDNPCLGSASRCRQGRLCDAGGRQRL